MMSVGHHCRLKKSVLLLVGEAHFFIAKVVNTLLIAYYFKKKINRYRKKGVFYMIFPINTTFPHS